MATTGFYAKTETATGVDRREFATEREAVEHAKAERKRNDATACYACRPTGRIVASWDRIDGRWARSF